MTTRDAAATKKDERGEFDDTGFRQVNCGYPFCIDRLCNQYNALYLKSGAVDRSGLLGEGRAGEPERATVPVNANQYVQVQRIAGQSCSSSAYFTKERL